MNTYWRNYRVVLHTSTVTAGISFDPEYFVTQVNVFNAKTCDAISFMQGSHRVRNIISKEIHTYIEQEYLSLPTTPAQFIEIEQNMCRANGLLYVLHYEPISQIIGFLKARDNALKQFQTQTLLKYVKSMNYSVKIIPI